MNNPTGVHLPTALLQQYPALESIDWNALPQGPPPGEEPHGGRNSFDYGSGDEYERGVSPKSYLALTDDLSELGGRTPKGPTDNQAARQERNPNELLRGVAESQQHARSAILRNIYSLFEILLRSEESSTLGLNDIKLNGWNDALGTFRIFLARWDAEIADLLRGASVSTSEMFHDAFHHNFETLESNLSEGTSAFTSAFDAPVRVVMGLTKQKCVRSRHHSGNRTN